MRALASITPRRAAVGADGEPTEPSRTFSFVCSTESEDRNGRIVIADWDLEAFTKNPIVLWNHGEGGSWCGDVEVDEYFPIGKASNVRVEGKKLLADITIGSEKANPLAERIFHALNEGLLNAVSVGWFPTDVRYEVHNEQEVLVLSGNHLVEISVVPMPANPDAVRASLCGRARELAQKKESKMPSHLTVATALGLHTDATEEQLGARAKELAELDATVRTLTGATTHPEATAKLVALGEKAKAHDALAESLEAERATAKQSKIAQLLKAGRDATKLTPANEPGLLKALCGDETGAKADPTSLELLIANLPKVANTEIAKTPVENKDSRAVPTASEIKRAGILGVKPEELAAERVKLMAERAGDSTFNDEDEEA